MRIQIERHDSTDEGSPGTLKVVETGFTCDTLELPWKNNEKGKSCITADIYNASIWYSPSFKLNVLRLEDKYNRQDCLIQKKNICIMICK